MTSMKIVKFSVTRTPLIHLHPKFLDLRDVGRPNSNKPPTPNDSRLIKRKYNPRMIIICYQVLRLTFVFSINSLIMDFPLTFLHFADLLPL